MVVDGKSSAASSEPYPRRGLVLSGVPATPEAPADLMIGQDGYYEVTDSRVELEFGEEGTPDHSKALAIQGLGRDDRACRRSAIRRLTLSAVRVIPTYW